MRPHFVPFHTLRPPHCIQTHSQRYTLDTEGIWGFAHIFFWYSRCLCVQDLVRPRQVLSCGSSQNKYVPVCLLMNSSNSDGLQNSSNTTLAQCGSYPLMVMNRTSNASDIGIPPYYLIAFSPGEIPTTSFIGTDPKDLSWTVNHPCGKLAPL